MPEAPVAEAPPTRESVNPGLRALFDVEPPAEYPVTTTEEDGTENKTAPPAPPDKKEEPAKPETPAEPEKKTDDALKLRLAPDFAVEQKVDTPPAEPPVKITDEMIESAKTPKAQADMRKFRDSYEALQKEVETLRSRPAVQQPTDYVEIKTTLESVTKERDDLLARVERTNLLDSPKFQKEHLEPRDKQFAKLVNVTKEGGADPAALQRAIAMAPGKARIEALDGIREEIGSEMLKGQFDRLVEDIDSRTADINERLRNAKQTAEELRRSEKVQTHEQRQKTVKHFEALLDSALIDLKDNVGLEVLHKTGKPEFQWFDEQADEIVSVAKEILLDATPEKAVIASVLAASAGPYRTMWQAERKARLAVEQENRELKGAEPSLSDKGKAPKADSEPADADAILERLRSGAYKK